MNTQDPTPPSEQPAPDDAPLIDYESLHPAANADQQSPPISRFWVRMYIILSCGFILTSGAFMLRSCLERAQRDRDYWRTGCASHLSSIGKALQLYARDYPGPFPDRAEDLCLTEDLSPECLICPQSNDTRAPGATLQQQVANVSKGPHCSYVYLGKGVNSKACPADAVLAYEPATNHNGNGGNVLFADGHVEFIDNTQLPKIIAIAKSGVRPVIWPPQPTAPTTTKP